MASVRAYVIVALMTATTLILVPIQWTVVKLNLPLQRYVPLLWHRITARLVGIRVHQRGELSKSRPLLIASNHVSWLDIVVLGSVSPLSFVAKSEVAGWPVFGLFAKLQRSIFVNRQRRSETGKTADELARRMADGDAMVLFAEGTSNNGNEVLPFRSALIGAVHRSMISDEDENAYVQPLSIAYTRLQGMPMGRFWRAHVAWYGDMELAGHLWSVIKEGGLDVELTWGEPIPIERKANRKLLTQQLETRVRSMTVSALNGRFQSDELVSVEAS